MNKFRIRNDQLEVEFQSKGAEITRIYNKETGLEYLWNANPAFWPKYSPVLFPIVGGLKNNTYFYQNQPYKFNNRHGFARESDFEVCFQDDNSVHFLLAQQEETLRQYPFHFEFQVQHTIRANSLFVTYFVKNTDTKELPFSFGAHPAFKIPLVDGTAFSDYYLQFNTAENTGRYNLSSEGLIEKTPVPFFENTVNYPLSKELFYKDALVFKTLQSDTISILSDKTSHGLKVQFKGFPFMGIWNFKDADFVCIEPWCGIADSVDTNQQILEKEGIMLIQPGEICSRTWSVEVF